MQEELFKVATSQGIWASMTVILIFYILKSQEKRDKKQEEREQKYQEIINKLTDQLYIVREIKDDVSNLNKF